MKRFKGFGASAGLLLCVAATTVGGEPDVAVPPEGYGVHYADTFDGPALNEKWESSRTSFAVQGGALLGGEREDAHHPAILKISEDFHDIVLRFSFRLEGTQSFSIVFNDINEKSVHSGHVARMTISPAGLSLTDDKLGLMSLEWVEKKHDPKFKEQIDQVREKTSRRFKQDWKQGHWYTVELKVVGEKATATVDGKEVGSFTSAGFGQPTKTSFHFSVSGRNLRVDNLTAWTPKKA